MTYLDYNKYIKANIPIRSVKLSHNIYIGEDAKIAAGASLFKTIVCRNATLEAKCDLKYCLVAEGTVVPENFKGTHCLLRGAGEKFEVLSWQHLVGAKDIELEAVELFPEETEEAENFDDDLKIILSEVPTPDTYKELSSLRKGYNKTCREFVNAMIYNLVPDTKQKILKIVNEWGDLLKKVSIDSSDLLLGLADGCSRQQEYQTLFPFFLRFLYEAELCSDTEIVSWYDENKGVE